jgi:hypothetical protein
MTVYRGTAVIAGQYVQINAPQGFGAINGLRLTNYTGQTVLVNNIASVGQSQEYLFPQQQMVYHTRNISRPPTAQGFLTHAAFSPNLLYVEWSDDSINDFIGTYPAFLPAPLASPDLGSPAILTANSALMVAAPPEVLTPVQFNTINGVQLPGPYVVPVGFELSITRFQITAVYSGVVGIAQFVIHLQTATHVYAVVPMTLEKTALADSPSLTVVQGFALGAIKIPAAATPTFGYASGPAGVTFSATVNATLMPTS